MIHIATVHYKTDKWIDIQLRYIKKCVTEPYKIYAVLNGVEKRFFNKFYFAADVDYPELFMNESHAAKLNYLAAEIISRANDEDILIFIDGDAFPINENVLPFIKEKIKNHKLTAIRRDENCGSNLSHPSFCATTVGFWKQIAGDWRLLTSLEKCREVRGSDAGGALLKKLIDQKINWFAMLRSNRKNLHPLFFGIYSNVIYHHGAGFRDKEPMCSADGGIFPVKYIDKLERYKISSRSLPSRIIRFTGWIIKKIYVRIRLNLMNRIYNEIRKDEMFYLRFLGKE